MEQAASTLISLIIVAISSLLGARGLLQVRSASSSHREKTLEVNSSIIQNSTISLGEARFDDSGVRTDPDHGRILRELVDKLSEEVALLPGSNLKDAIMRRVRALTRLEQEIRQLLKDQASELHRALKEQRELERLASRGPSPGLRNRSIALIGLAVAVSTTLIIEADLFDSRSQAASTSDAGSTGAGEVWSDSNQPLSTPAASANANESPLYSTMSCPSGYWVAVLYSPGPEETPSAEELYDRERVRVAELLGEEIVDVRIGDLEDLCPAIRRDFITSGDGSRDVVWLDPPLSSRGEIEEICGKIEPLEGGLPCMRVQFD